MIIIIQEWGDWHAVGIKNIPQFTTKNLLE